MHIRPLVPADRAQWDPLWRGYLEFYEAAIPADVTELTWTRFFDPVQPIFALGALVDDRLAGFAHYQFHLSTWSAGPYCYLEDLFVDPERRGQSIGRRLIEATTEQARLAGATQLYWLTQASNLRAMALYDRVARRSGFLHYLASV